MKAKRHFTVNGAPVAPSAIGFGVLASVGGFLFGYDIGQISGFVTLDDFKLRFASCTSPNDPSSCTFSNVREGLIVAMLSIGTLIGALTGAPIADRIGRRKAMVVNCIALIIGSVIQIASIRSWEQFMVGRIVTGLGVGALSAAVPLYQSETTPKELRGSLVATYQLMVDLGILLAYVFEYGTRKLTGTPHASGSWRIILGLNFLWSIILAVGIMFAQESPRWLYAKGNKQGAEAALASLRGVSVAEKDVSVLAALNEIENNLAEEHRAHVGWLDCFRSERKTRYRTLLVMTMQAGQQLTGANYFFYYGNTIFLSVGLTDPFITQIIIGAVFLFGTCVGLFVLERFGRRRPLILGGIWQSIWLFVFASVGTAKNPSTHPNTGKVMIASAVLFILSYGVTWAPAVWILTGETFATRSRAKQAALAVASNWTWNFLLSFFTPFITSAIGYRFGFIFAACNLAAAAFTFLFLYESAGLSLEMIDTVYNDPNVKPWHSVSWAPPGYDSRADYRRAIGKAEAEAKVEHREFASDSASENGTAIGDRLSTEKPMTKMMA